jgi:hypothetical protein
VAQVVELPLEVTDSLEETVLVVAQPVSCSLQPTESKKELGTS